jgi:hypothetical protein
MTRMLLKMILENGKPAHSMNRRRKVGLNEV